MHRPVWHTLLFALLLLGSSGLPPVVAAQSAPVPPLPPLARTPVPPMVRTPVAPVVRTPTAPRPPGASVPTPGPLLGGAAPPAVCGAMYARSFSAPLPVAFDHTAIFGLRPKQSDVYSLANVQDLTPPGAVNATNCPGISSMVNTLILNQPRIIDNFMYLGPHTVLQVNVYPSASKPPFTGAPSFTQVYGTEAGSDGVGAHEANPLVLPVASGPYLSDVWNTTGEIAIFDTLDWLIQHGTCTTGCDFSGYTLQDLALRQESGGVTYPYAAGATFRNVTFGPGMQLQLGNFRNAVFENVTMDAPNLSGADFSGAQFIGRNSITNADVTGTNFSSTSFSADTQLVGLRVGKNGRLSDACTSFANADLLAGTLQIASITDACVGTSPVFSGARVRPSIAAPAVWRALDWSGAVIVWSAADRTLLQQQDLHGVNLSHARMWGIPAGFAQSDLSGADLTSASFDDADLSGAVLTGVNAAGASFGGATLTGARLNQPDGGSTILDNATFIGATLDGASFAGASLLGANFSQARANGTTDFGSTKASGAIFNGAHILGNPRAFEGAVFDPDQQHGPASFVGAVLGGSFGNSQGINFTGAHLINANFSRAQCIGCVFAGSSPADLAGANFSEAYLDGAIFSGARLNGANFAGAELSGTNGTWTFQLGFKEAPFRVAYGPTDFGSASTATVQSCPNGTQPDPSSSVGCNGKTTANPPPLTPACSAAGQDACPSPVKTVLGTGTAGSGTNQVASPSSIAVARNGEVYVADTANHVIRKLSSAGYSVLAGRLGQDGDSGDGGPANAALLEEPVGLAIGADDPPTIYVSDRRANRVRKIVQSFDASGQVQAVILGVAGSGQACTDPAGTCGDGPDPAQAQLSGPEAVWADPLGNVYIADTQANKLRVALHRGGIRTLAGTGRAGYAGDGGQASAASFAQPAGIVGDVFGNIFVADTANNRVRRIDASGAVSTVFGTGVAGYNGTYDLDALTNQYTVVKSGSAAQLNAPRALATDIAGNVFVADTGNGLLRRWSTNGKIALVAGNTVEAGAKSTVSTAYNGDGLPANKSGFSQPGGIAVTDVGTYWTSDTGHQRVRSFGPYTL